MMSFDPELARYKDQQMQEFYEQLTDRSRSLPGIRSVALTEVIPTAPTQHQQDIVPEGNLLPKDRANLSVFADIVDGGFFNTMAVPILRGRGFNESDSANAPKVAVVNDVLARHYWPNQNAVGKRLRLNDDKSREIEIVEIASASTYLRLGEGPTEYLYLPLVQNTHSRMTLVVQSFGDAASLVPELLQTVRGLDANLPVYDVRTVSDFYQEGAASPT
jgi:hypothetical protein